MADTQTSRSKTLGLILSAVPAAGLTVGLFFMMGQLVRTDTVQLSEVQFRPFDRVVPQKDKIEEPRKTTRVEKVTPLDLPEPRTPEQIKTDTLIISYKPVEAVEPEMPGSDMMPLGGLPEPGLTRQVAIPIRQPVPDYPQIAMTRGLNGDCDVTFAIDPQGRPYNVEASCSDKIFKRSSEQAVRKALFAARVSNGVAMGQENLVYPIRYELNDD